MGDGRGYLVLGEIIRERAEKKKAGEDCRPAVGEREKKHRV